MNKNDKTKRINSLIGQIETCKGHLEYYKNNIQECEKRIEEINHTKKYLIRVYEDNRLIKSWDEEIDSRVLHLRISEIHSELGHKKISEVFSENGITYETVQSKYYIVTDAYLED